MTTEDICEFADEMNAVWPTYQLTEKRCGLLEKHFHDVPLPKMVEAIDLLIHEPGNEYPPSLPKLIEFVGKAHPPYRKARALFSPAQQVVTHQAKELDHDPLAVIEKEREKLKALYSNPVPRKDVEEDEVVAGNEDQRFVTRSEQKSIDELFRNDKPKRKSAVGGR